MAPIVQGNVSLTVPRHKKNINQPVRSKPQYFAARQGSRNMLDASKRSTNSFCGLFVVEDAMLFPVSIVAAVEQDARILNLLDKQTVLSVDRVPYLDPPIQTATFPFITQPTTTPNPNFGKPASFAAPRRYIASVRFDF